MEVPFGSGFGFRDFTFLLFFINTILIPSRFLLDVSPLYYTHPSWLEQFHPVHFLCVEKGCEISHPPCLR